MARAGRGFLACLLLAVAWAEQQHVAAGSSTSGAVGIGPRKSLLQAIGGEQRTVEVRLRGLAACCTGYEHA